MSDKLEKREIDRFYHQEREAIQILQKFIFELRSGTDRGEIQRNVSKKLTKIKFSYFQKIAFVGHLTILVAAAETNEEAKIILEKSKLVNKMRDWSAHEMRVFCYALGYHTLCDVTYQNLIPICRRLAHLKAILQPDIAENLRILAAAKVLGVKIDIQAPYRQISRAILSKINTFNRSNTIWWKPKTWIQVRALVDDARLTLIELSVNIEDDNCELIDEIGIISDILGAKVDEYYRSKAKKSLTQWVQETGYNEVLLDWHPTKNAGITPDSINSMSKTTVHWLCHKCGFESRSKVYNRTKIRSGCRSCFYASKAGKPLGKKKLNELALEKDLTYLIEEWHPSNPKKPEDFSAKSCKLVKWRCRLEHCNFEWTASISGRSIYNKGCPACAGKKVTPKNCLANTHPTLVIEWDSTRNDTSAHQYTHGSGNKVWWQCSKETCGFVWRATIASRAVQGSGCPACAGQIATLANNLTISNPEVAKEWSDLNSFSPASIKAGSGKKVWWCCSRCQNLWEAVISYRTKRGSGCPLCFKMRIKRRMDKRRSRRRGESNIKLEV